MGEDRFEVENLTMVINEKPVANLTDCKLESFATDYQDEYEGALWKALALGDGEEDEELEDRGFFGTLPGDELVEIDCRANVINIKLLLEMLFGPCKSGRWRLRKRALDMIHLSRMRKEREYDKRLGIDYGQH